MTSSIVAGHRESRVGELGVTSETPAVVVASNQVGALHPPSRKGHRYQKFGQDAVVGIENPSTSHSGDPLASVL